MDFTDLSYQEKVDALTSGICSQFPKALTLYAMEAGMPYTVTRFYSRIASFLDIPQEDLPFSLSVPQNNCRDSLTPIGCVTKLTVERDNQKGTVIAYQKTDAGEKYGDAAVLRALKASKEAGISLRRMIGAPHKSKKANARKGYTIAKILDCLKCGDKLKDKDISEKIGVSYLGDTLKELDNMGFIERDYIKHDSYGGVSEKKFAVYTLIDKRKAEEYLNDKEKLKKDVNSKAKNFSNWSYIQETIKCLVENNEATCNDIKTSIRKQDVSTCLSILSKIGIAKKPEFTTGNHSSTRITDKGLKVLEIYFGHVLKISKDENFQNEDALNEWNSIKYELSEKEKKDLFEYQKCLYRDEKQSSTKKEAKEKENGIMQVLTDTKKMRDDILKEGNPDIEIDIPYKFRVKEIFDIVKSDSLLKIKNKCTFGECLERLEKKGKIKHAEKTGFYYLMNGKKYTR